MNPELSLLFISVTVVLVIIALSRNVNLWYWKINKRIKNQETIISLLKEQNDLLKSFVSPQVKTISEVKSETAPIDESDLITVEELKSKCKPGDLIIKSKKTNRIEICSSLNWEDIKELGNENKFEVLHKA